MNPKKTEKPEMIPEDFIQKAKTVDLPEVLRSKNIQLFSANGGSSFKCLCPFHDEKTPSLHVNRRDGIWVKPGKPDGWGQEIIILVGGLALSALAFYFHEYLSGVALTT